MKKTVQIFFAIIGFIFFCLGVVGAFLPILPTTPFLLLASFFFAKSSKRFNDWFKSTKLYKTHLDTFMRERSMTLKTKCSICALATTMMLIAIITLNNLYGRIFIACMILFMFYYFIFRIKTIKQGESLVVEEVSESVHERGSASFSGKQDLYQAGQEEENEQPTRPAGT